MHFGCINPFCGHGNPALPHHWELPMNTKAMALKLVAHSRTNRRVIFKVTLKADSPTGLKAGAVRIITADDNLEACKTTFKQVFGW